MFLSSKRISVVFYYYYLLFISIVRSNYSDPILIDKLKKEENEKLDLLQNTKTSISIARKFSLSLFLSKSCELTKCIIVIKEREREKERNKKEQLKNA